MLASSLDFIYGVPYVHRTVLIYLAQGNEFRCSFNFGESIRIYPAKPTLACLAKASKVDYLSQNNEYVTWVLHFETTCLALQIPAKLPQPGRNVENQWKPTIIHTSLGTAKDLMWKNANMTVESGRSKPLCRHLSPVVANRMLCCSSPPWKQNENIIWHR